MMMMMISVKVEITFFWFFFGGGYGISTLVGNLMPNPFLYKLTVLFPTIQFSISTQFNCQKHLIWFGFMAY